MSKIQFDHLLELSLEKLVIGGEALARYQQQVVFVPTGVPGDKVLARVISVKKSHARALIEKVLEASPARQSPPCPVFNTCGGCQWQHINYASQLQAKRALLLEAMVKQGGWPQAELEALCAQTLGMSDPWAYRNKGQFPIQALDGRLHLGFYAQRSHQLIPLQTCLIQQQPINQVLNWVQGRINQLGLSAYDEQQQHGELRHLLVRHSEATGQMLVGFVSTSKRAESALLPLAKELVAHFPQVVGVLHNLQPAASNRILGDQTHLLAGQPVFIEQLGDLKFELSLPAFFQVNPRQTGVLYNTVLQLAAPTAADRVLDAYSGAGTISLWLARHCASVLGIEVVAAATENARRNAALNQIKNAEFVTGKVEALLAEQLQQQHFQIVVLDPPRKGCEDSIIEALGKAQIPRLVYVSCHPVTLARDSSRLRELGYQLQALQPVDMFPQTHHLETVALFELT